MPVSRILACLALCLATLVSVRSDAQPAPSPSPRAAWINPYNDVKVETGDCGGKLCGWVVWATPEAEAEAREAGTAKLVGTQLLYDYHPTGPNAWEGHVFVPDMGRTFYSTITKPDENTLKISGCILGGFICRSQIWHRA